MEKCNSCQSFELAYVRQVARNGMLQLKLFCTKCGAYVKFLPHSESHRFADVTPTETNLHPCQECEYFLPKIICQMTGEKVINLKQPCILYKNKGQ